MRTNSLSATSQASHSLYTTPNVLGNGRLDDGYTNLAGKTK